ncbi:MAG: hypothetical protein RIQ54_520 [Candidatus Parcubacteria bacterium]
MKKNLPLSPLSHAHQRVGIFVDVQNLYHSSKNLYRGRVNYPELIKHLTGDRQLIRSMAYVVKSDSALGESSFFEALEKAGMELRMKDLQIYPDGTKKADWDIGMAVDAIRMASFLDVVILVTGDGDFLPLVDYLKWGVGRFVEVAAFRRSTSSKIQEVADRFVNLEDVPRIILRSHASTASRRLGQSDYQNTYE